MIIKCPHCDKDFYFVLKEVANNVFVNPYQDINGPVQIPADDSNYDGMLEDNVNSAVRKRNNVIRLREIDLTDDDWYFGC